jgi:anti-sigma28 factor (negative regulator of flagellin synthesis)
MKVESAKGVREIERIPAPAERSVNADNADRKDKVSLEEAQRAEALGRAAAQGATSGRPARLQQIEAAVRAGSYVPKASQIAEQLLSAAEVDARLQVMLGR